MEISKESFKVGSLTPCASWRGRNTRKIAPYIVNPADGFSSTREKRHENDIPKKTVLTNRMNLGL